jgi:hypothetical protein
LGRTQPTDPQMPLGTKHDIGTTLHLATE